MTNHEPGGRSPEPDLPAPDTTSAFSPAPGPPMRLSGAGQLLAVLPHLLGYRPERSIVVVALALDPRGTLGQLVFAGRLDLPETPDLRVGLQQLHHAVQQAADGSRGPILLAVFGHDLPTGPGGDVDAAAVEGLLAASRGLAHDAGCHVHDLVLVRDTPSGGQMCAVVADGEIVPEQERAWGPAPSAPDVPAVADLVLSGRGVLPSRAAVAASVRRRDEEASRATAIEIRLLHLAPGPVDEGRALRDLDACLHEGRTLDARRRAQVAVLLHDRWVRDAVLARWLPDLPWSEDDASVPRELVEATRALRPWPTTSHHLGLERLLTLVSEVPRDLGGPLLTLGAMAAWTRGDGTVANELCDLALEVDPGSQLAALLRRALEVGLRPPRRAPGRQGGPRAGGPTGRRPRGRARGRARGRSGGRPAA
ncbi:hypothetical protein AVL62_01990 [Serinicoccus chungangensis]|uniref:DUF4192 domain-containing protein n=1 Tax=Serinicoccus chungangensis TaxID=767452 RepID=A0A0W8I5N7_9MICO|nr:DUF4192 domain-containing protein [Serinicoccus chungangensis]KUG53578.1 hypothetical protein AVL62_01990 [Serinicoccus chungangensis]